MGAEVRPTNERLTRDRVVRAAIEVADRDGLGALTMRRLGDALGVEAMSLYNHVANKDDLLDGMTDAVFGEIERPVPGTEWRTAMAARARSARAVLARHPWAIVLMDSRARPGPATLGHLDAVIGTLRTAGFSVVLTAHALALLDSYVYGFAQQEASLPFESGDETAALAESILSDAAVEQFPHLRELTTDHVMQPGYDHGREFDWGLKVVLDGLERARRAD